MPTRLLKKIGDGFTDPEVLAHIPPRDLKSIGQFNARNMSEESIQRKVAKIGGDYYYPLENNGQIIVAYSYKSRN